MIHLGLVLLAWLGVAAQGCREGCSTTNLTSCKLIPTEGPHPFLFLTVLKEEVGELSGELWSECQIVDYLEIRDRGVTSLKGSPFITLNNLSTLDLSNNSIQLITAEAFRGLSKLKKLNLDWSGVKVILEGAFDGLPELRFLYLSHNYLFEVPADLPPTLDSLDLSHNQIKHPNFRQISVKELELCGNRLEGGLDKVLLVDGLEKLCLTMPGLEEGSLPSGTLPPWPNLTRLEISCQQMAPLSDTFQQIIAQLPAITHLSIENCSLSSLKWLEKLLGLEELWLQSVVLLGRSESAIRLPRLDLLSLEDSPSLLPILDNYTTTLPNLQLLRLRKAGVKKLSSPGGGLRFVDLSENPLDCDESWWTWLTSAPELLSNPEDTLCYDPPQLRNSPILFALQPHHRLDVKLDEDGVETKEGGSLPEVIWFLGGLCLSGLLAPFVWLAFTSAKKRLFNSYR